MDPIFRVKKAELGKLAWARVGDWLNLPNAAEASVF